MPQTGRNSVPHKARCRLPLPSQPATRPAKEVLPGSFTKARSPLHTALGTPCFPRDRAGGSTLAAPLPRKRKLRPKRLTTFTASSPCPTSMIMCSRAPSCGRAWGAPPGKAEAPTQTGNRMQRYKTMQAKANMQVIFFTATTINHNQHDVTATRRQRTATASRPDFNTHKQAAEPQPRPRQRRPEAIIRPKRSDM